ncbi:MAG: tyrosine-protein phosphatase [Proteobacteria bacterium]|nr:tyrosine-protein phosphatase [Pseudomonadota bacterium]
MVELQHGHNFRDIGGYRAGSVTTRWGCVYRSGSLAWLSHEDQDQLQARGISAIFDLRSDGERRARPSRVERLQPAIHGWREHPGSVANLLTAMRRRDTSSGDLRQMMIGFYRELPFEQSESLSKVYQLIAGGSVPLIVHCSAGKDRTGVAIALLLALVGVEHDLIFEDYLLTESCFEKTRGMVIRENAQQGATPVDVRIWEPVLRADPAYLDAMFETVMERCGSLDAYFEQHLRVDAPARAAIRRHLTG